MIRLRFRLTAKASCERLYWVACWERFSPCPRRCNNVNIIFLVPNCVKICGTRPFEKFRSNGEEEARLWWRNVERKQTLKECLRSDIYCAYLETPWNSTVALLAQSRTGSPGILEVMPDSWSEGKMARWTKTKWKERRVTDLSADLLRLLVRGCIRSAAVCKLGCCTRDVRPTTFQAVGLNPLNKDGSLYFFC